MKFCVSTATISVLFLLSSCAELIPEPPLNIFPDANSYCTFRQTDNLSSFSNLTYDINLDHLQSATFQKLDRSTGVYQCTYIALSDTTDAPNFYQNGEVYALLTVYKIGWRINDQYSKSFSGEWIDNSGNADTVDIPPTKIGTEVLDRHITESDWKKYMGLNG